MRLGRLQKYILLECYLRRGKKVAKRDLVRFYNRHKKKIKHPFLNVTISVSRLIKQGLLLGSGVKTPHKWYIKEIKLTLRGRHEAKKLLGRQEKLPFNRQRSC